MMKSNELRVTSTRQLGDTAQLPVNQVIGLRRLPRGPVHLFGEFRIYGQAKRALLVGASDACDIRLADDRFVSSTHCLIRLRGQHVHVSDCDSKNGIRVNGLPVEEAELFDFSLLEVGKTQFMAFSAQSAGGNLLVAASTMRQFLERAIELQGGNQSAAAAALGIKRSTLRSLLDKDDSGDPEG